MTRRKKAADAGAAKTSVRRADAPAPTAESAPAKKTQRSRHSTKRAAAAPSKPAVDTAAAQQANDGVLLRLPIDVRWRDLDAFNHVNNSNFLTYIEEARLRWFSQLGTGWYDENVAPVIAAVHINYRRPIEWPASLAVTLHAERAGRTSLTLGHRIVDAGNDGVLYADGNAVLVWIDRRGGRPAELPDVVRTAVKLPDAG